MDGCDTIKLLSRESGKRFGDMNVAGRILLKLILKFTLYFPVNKHEDQYGLQIIKKDIWKVTCNPKWTMSSYFSSYIRKYRA
jgi:hypothetical protein